MLDQERKPLLQRIGTFPCQTPSVCRMNCGHARNLLLLWWLVPDVNSLKVKLQCMVLVTKGALPRHGWAPPRFCFCFRDSQNDLGWKGPKAHLVPNPLPWSGTSSIDQVVQHPVQWGLELFQGRGSTVCLGNLCQCCTSCIVKSFWFTGCSRDALWNRDIPCITEIYQLQIMKKKRIFSTKQNL